MNFWSPLALLVLLLLLPAVSRAQSGGDTIRSSRPRTPASRTIASTRVPLSRIIWPLSGKYSFGGGLGVEYSLTPELSFEINSLFVAHSAKARYFLMGRNIAPFMSIGFGLADERFARRGVDGRWIEAQVGVERAVDRGYMRLQLHYTINQTPGLGWPQFSPDFTIGYRF